MEKQKNYGSFAGFLEWLAQLLSYAGTFNLDYPLLDDCC